mgnify:CR=1 FL=1
MTGDLTALFEIVKKDVRLMDALNQWISTPTGCTVLKKGDYPDHKLIRSNLRARYGLEEANLIYDQFKNAVTKYGFNFDTSFNDLPENEIRNFFNQNPDLKNFTLTKLQSAELKEKEIAWLYCKLKDQWPIYSWYSYSDDDTGLNKKTFAKFGGILKILFSTPTNKIEVSKYEIINSLIKLGFVNELEWLTSKTNKRTGEYVFSPCLEDVARDIDKHISLKWEL